MQSLVLAAAACHLLMIGDSTVGPNTGYGAALCARFAGRCSNAAVGGTTSASYVAKGYWENAKAQVVEGMIVLIEFGHNDRWSADPNKVSNFLAAYRQYVGDVRTAGGVPIIVTPLAERQFVNGRLVDSLAPWADRAKQAGREHKVPVLPLHDSSFSLVQRLGPVGSMQLAQLPPSNAQIAVARTGTSPDLPTPVKSPRFDYTHLGSTGATLTAKLIQADLTKLGWGRCFLQR